jgi:hypothetical protein
MAYCPSRSSVSNYARGLRARDGRFTGHRKTEHSAAVVRRFVELPQGSEDAVGRHPRLEWRGSARLSALALALIGAPTNRPDQFIRANRASLLSERQRGFRTFLMPTGSTAQPGTPSE